MAASNFPREESPSNLMRKRRGRLPSACCGSNAANAGATSPIPAASRRAPRNIIPIRRHRRTFARPSRSARSFLVVEGSRSASRSSFTPQIVHAVSSSDCGSFVLGSCMGLPMIRVIRGRIHLLRVDGRTDSAASDQALRGDISEFRRRVAKGLH